MRPQTLATMAEIPPPLPNEILNLVIEHLRAPSLCLGDQTPDDSYRTNQAALCNLCLSSRVLNSIALPVLYHTVVFHDKRSPSLYRLLRTLAQRTDLPMLVKSVAFTTSARALGRWMTRWLLDEGKRHPESIIFCAPDDDPDFFGASGLSMTVVRGAHHKPVNLVERMLGSLLCFTPCVRTFLIETRHQQDLSALQDVFAQQIVAKVLAGPSAARPLPNLENLRVQTRSSLYENEFIS